MLFRPKITIFESIFNFAAEIPLFIMRRSQRRYPRRVRMILFIGFVSGVLFVLGSNKFLSYTSTDEYCVSCHIHPEADKSWELSRHRNNSKSGTYTHCVDCHLPPPGNFNHLKTKAVVGSKDLWKYLVKDSASFDWTRKRGEYATKHVFNESCERCHQNLFTKELRDSGLIAHIYYRDNRDKKGLQCIACHSDVGHDKPGAERKKNIEFGTDKDNSGPKTIYDSATKLTGFADFTEYVPGTSVSFNMKAIKGGTFKMGSLENEPFRNSDEGPVREVTLSPFYMAEAEVTWNEYHAFYGETKSEGRISPSVITERNKIAMTVDAVSGPTSPYGNPDQGWGYGKNPAITMTYYGAQTYCQWLSMKTGKKYRLPTEAEWEYAARGGSATPYFFEGSPKKYTGDRWWNKIFGIDTAVIARYAVYYENSGGRTRNADFVEAGPFGLKNMSGNVTEYCSDYYAPDAYAQTPDKITNPTGPPTGEEHVVRGGYFNSDAKNLRSAARDYTRSIEWLKTDPQSPKSIWWLSDFTGIGFRIVCEP